MASAIRGRGRAAGRGSRPGASGRDRAPEVAGEADDPPAVTDTPADKDGDGLEAVCELERNVQLRAEELRRDLALLQSARKRMLCREAEAELRKLREEEERQFEDFLHEQAQEVLSALERELKPARQQSEALAANATACASKLRSLRAEVLAWLAELEEAAERSEQEIGKAAETVLGEQRQRRRERISVEMRLLMEEIGEVAPLEAQ
ncbi:unnamed protein product, partial [Polarella glacialis]